MGRPEKYTEELGAAILARVIEGESLRSIMRDPAMPDRLSFYRWLIAHPDFRNHYDLARELQGQAWADEIIDEARDSSGDIIRTGDGETMINNANVQRSRVRVDSLKWILSKLHHKQYGDRTHLDVTTPPGQPFEVARPLCPDEVAEQIQKMLAENERELGLVPAPDATDSERLKQILATGEPVSPALFSAVRGNDKRFPWKDCQ